MQAEMSSIQEDTLEGIKSLGRDRILAHVYWTRALALSLRHAQTQNTKILHGLVFKYPLYIDASSSRKFKFCPIDLETSLGLCLQFRLDADRAVSGALTRVTKTKGLGIGHYIASLKNQVQSFPGSCVHLVLGHRAVGQIELSFNKNKGHIHLFYLVQDYRGKGWGEVLEAYALRYFSLLGCMSVSLKAHQDNQMALRFYERMQWKRSPIPSSESGDRLNFEKSVDSFC